MTLKDIDEMEPGEPVYFVFFDPDDEDVPEVYDQEKAREYYEAAKFIQTRLGVDRHAVVGQILSALYETEMNDNDEPLDKLVEQLKR